MGYGIQQSGFVPKAFRMSFTASASGKGATCSGYNRWIPWRSWNVPPGDSAISLNAGATYGHIWDGEKLLK